jgi:hypothetical protein
MINGPSQFFQRFGWCTGGVAELRRCGGGGGQPEYLAAAVAPRPSQGPHGGGLPAPAGAIASCSRVPEVHMARTSAACPASKAFPFAADSSRAKSTVSASTTRPSLRPPVATSRCSAARIRAEVNSSDPATVYTLEPSARRKVAGSLMLSSVRVRATDLVCSTSATSSSTSCSTLSVGTCTVRRCRWASARTCQLCQVERCSSTAASIFSAVADTHSASMASLGAELRLRACPDLARLVC